MNKKITLGLVLSGLLISNSFAQVTLSTKTETYTNLSGGTQLMKDSVWDEFENNNASNDLAIPLGFNFTFNKFVHDTLFLFDVNLVGNDFATIFGSGMNMCDRGIGTKTSKSPIFIKREGTAPNRIVKVEWRNAGFVNEVIENGTIKDSLTSQIWFYESGNKLEIHIGPSNVSGTFPEYLKFISFGIWSKESNPSAIINGSAAAPTLATDLTTATGLDDFPSAGTVYTFAVDANYSFTHNSQPAPAAVYYSNGSLFTKSNKTEQFKIYSVEGKLVFTGKFENNTANLTQLAAGTYVAITNACAVKFVKE